jgi:hypothetical protein
MKMDVVELEGALKAIEGVLGCVILMNDDGTAGEIQAFVRVGNDKDRIHEAILHEVQIRGAEGSLRDVYVFELDAESEFGDRESLVRAAELAEQEARIKGPAGAALLDRLERDMARFDRPNRTPSPRPPLKKVVLTSTHWTSEAEVALGEDADFVGRASGDKTPHGLKVLGEATLEAVGKIMGDTRFTFEGASLVNILGREAVMVLVRLDDLDTVGAALVREAPVTEAAVRATLDAVNRRLDLR